ncbi:lymphocyte antigen 6E-like [Bombina bombina]|uniref:lymphocyte antigen 6E-like n=1 Tax=Bombina bombina TaxID=8345 RepID=UPI00235B27F8|nr:lymphocyte antigen 6E-like [Bombina bombina]
MEAVKAILLVTALCIGTAYSLSCYTCLSESNNANCMTSQSCSDTDAFCMTTVAAAGVAGISFASITKECAAICQETGIGILGASTSVSCCDTDLCNTSGASGVKSSYAILALCVGLLLALLRNSSL